ncbi:MAG: serine hydroxymethyltransferase [Patescibacteria group bacterium]|nr:serine hydroxymethyltransferase [Patescibacteria group bacterium]
MDNVLLNLLKKEIERQETTLELIPSENFVDLETLFFLGSPLVNKYAEGYPTKRYYPGNSYIDQIEKLAQGRALKAFNLNNRYWSVNVQPYSGSPANLEIYLALIQPGETIMGLNLFSGGHLSHGHKVSQTGRIFKSVQYAVNYQTERIDYGEVETLARKYKPKIIISGASAYPLRLDFKKFGQIAKNVGAYHLADISHIAGLVSANLHPSPFPFADIVMTTTHKTLRGPRGAVIFMRKNLEAIINKTVFPGFQGGPHIHTIAAIAYAFGQAKKKSFLLYQKQIIKNAQRLSFELKKRGFKLFADGTENHLMLIDLKPLGLDGRTAETVLEAAGIIANRNSLPGDLSPFNPSGLRLGAPAITSRGLKEKDMIMIADWFDHLLLQKKAPIKIKKAVSLFLKRYPLPYRRWLKLNLPRPAKNLI